MHRPRLSEELERRIRVWRDQLVVCIDEPTTVIELEDHLREALAECLASNPDDILAWDKAAMDFGDMGQLKAEFSKLQQSGLDRTVLRGLVLIGAVCGLGFLLLIGVQSQGRGTGMWLTVHVATTTLAYVSALTLCGMGLFIAARRLTGATWYATGMHPLDRRDLQRSLRFGCQLVTVCSAIGLVFGAICALRETGRAWSWDPRETGALLVFAYHAVWWRTRASQQDETGRLAVLGGAITLLAWFGASMLTATQDVSVNGVLLLGALLLTCVALVLGTTIQVNGSRTPVDRA